MIAYAPLPLGGNRNWTVATLAFASTGLLICSWCTLMWRGRSPLAYLAPARVPLIALGLYAALVAAQWWGGADHPLFFSAAPHQTRLYLLCSLTYGATFMVTLLLARTPRRIWLLSIVLVASGGLQALLAIYWLSVGAQYQFMFEDVAHGTQATGTFMNRNHLAGYMYLTLSAGIGLLLGAIDSSGPVARRLRDQVVST